MNNLDSTQSFHHASQKARGWITTCQDDLDTHGFFFRKETQFCFVGPSERSSDYRVRLRKMVWSGIYGNAHPLRTNATYPHGLSLYELALPEVVGSGGCYFFLTRRREREQFLNADL